MREHEIQIQKYTKMLPRMRERVVAALALLLIAAVMMVSASFAWVVLTTSPEVKGLKTTIAANGNLEIALAHGTTITAPQASQVGDGGKNLPEKNITWGNLINLADESYGLENIVLRPAALNDDDLIGQPLYGASYGSDGRVDTLVKDYAYAYWDTANQVFSADQVRYGVRTVSSVIYGEAGGNIALAEAVNVAEAAYLTAKEGLNSLINHSDLQILLTLMGGYVQAQVDEKLNGGDEPTIYVTDEQVRAIYNLSGLLKENVEDSADALAAVYNISVLRRAGQAYMAENKFTGNFLLTATEEELNAKLAQKNGNQLIVEPVMLEELVQLRLDYQTIIDDRAVLNTYIGRGDVVYRDLTESGVPAVEPMVCRMADVSTTTIDGTPLGQLSMSSVLSMLNSTPKSIKITKGIFQRMDQFIGGRVVTENTLVISLSVYGYTREIYGYVSNEIAEPFVLPTEKSVALGADTSYKGSDPMAKDTYGMALDFFVRTNAPGSHLVLQGSPVYAERDVVVTVEVGAKKYNLYTVVVDGVEKTAYLDTVGGKYYEYDREREVALGALGTTETITQATLLTEKERYAVGYNGVNRVWDENESAFLDGDSTTQGAGSCYTFYASSPEDQRKAKDLLSHLRIAFIDQNGTLLGGAYLDIGSSFERTGKVTIPLVLSTTNSFVEGVDGTKTYTITRLQANQATFITALVYLEGSTLTNDQVLAAGEIQGQLNLQFGTTAELDAMDDSTAMQEKCYVSATMEGDTEVSFDTATTEQLTKQIKVSVAGYTPQKVEAYFLREVNELQGVRQDKMIFEINSNKEWVKSYTFTSPGKYVLRDVQLDGVTYELSSPITFTINGFGITQMTCEHDERTIMTADREFNTSVSLTFAGSDPKRMPSTVKGAFIHKKTGDRTTVYFKNVGGANWVGEVKLSTSGEYTMDYLELDGQYTGLAAEKHISIQLYLGLTAKVYTAISNLALEEGQTRDIEVTMTIHTDDGSSIPNLNDVWLQYAVNGSTAQENGLGAGMVWSGARNCYVGNFHLQRGGIFNYYYTSIDVDSELNYVRTATQAPVITAISSNPVRYVSKSGFGEVFALNKDATFKVRMRNAGSATVDAAVKDAAGKTYYLRGALADYGTEQEFTFTLPIVNDAQSGTYTLQGLYLTNIYGGAANKLYDGSIANGPDVAADGKPMYAVGNNYYLKWLYWPLAEITAEEESDVDKAASITILSEISVAFTDSSLNANKEFGKDANGNVTATFDTQHALGELEMSVTAGNEGRPLSDFGYSVTDVLLVYGYDPNSVYSRNGMTVNDYGGYSVAQNWGDIASVTVTEHEYNAIRPSDSGAGKYILSTEGSLSVAGRYIVSTDMVLTLTDGSGKTYQVRKRANQLNAPSFTVWSKAPWAKFISTSPAVGTAFNAINDAQDNTISVANSIENNGLKLTVYYEAKKSGCDCDGFTASTATAELLDMGSNFSSASFVIGGTGTSVTYTFTPSDSGNPTKEATIGASGDTPVYLGANIMVTQISVVDTRGYAYVFYLPADKQLDVTCNR